MTNNTNGKVCVAWQVPIGTGEKNKKKEKGEKDKDKDKDKDKEDKNKTNEDPEKPSFEGKNILSDFICFYFPTLIRKKSLVLSLLYYSYIFHDHFSVFPDYYPKLIFIFNNLSFSFLIIFLILCLILFLI
jgi:hypothetical protein